LGKLNYFNSTRISCWYTLIPESPILSIFVFLNLVGIFQYLLKKRLDSLKEQTWAIIDQKNENKLKLIQESLEKLSKLNDTLKNLNKRKSVKVSEISLDDKPKEDKVDSQKDDDSDKEPVKERDGIENDQTFKDVETNSSDDDKGFKNIKIRIKILKFLTSKIFMVGLVFVWIVVKNLKDSIFSLQFYFKYHLLEFLKSLQ
jgi:hypothetical protein